MSQAHILAGEGNVGLMGSPFHLCGCCAPQRTRQLGQLQIFTSCDETALIKM